MLKSNLKIIHGNAISYNNQYAIILFGNSTSGKTRLSLELCQKYNFKLISDDHIYYYNKSKTIQIHRSDNQFFFDKHLGIRYIPHNKLYLSQSIPLKYIFILDKDYLNNIITKEFNYHKVKYFNLTCKTIQERAKQIKGILCK